MALRSARTGAPSPSLYGPEYLVLTNAAADITDLEDPWRAVMAARPDGNLRPLMSGHWKVVGSTSKLMGQSSMGTVHISILSPKERQ